MEALTSLFTSMKEQMSTANCKVDKLTDKNYFRWKRDMTLYLQDTDLWDTVENPVPNDNAITPEWSRKDRHALSLIHSCCDPQRQDLFADCTHAHLAWARLKATFESHDPATIRRLYLDFNRIRKSHDESVLNYISRVKSAALHLSSLGEVISTPVLLNTIVSSLGDQFEAVQLYLSFDTNLTELWLTQILQSEESRLLSRRSENTRDRSLSPRRAPSNPRSRSPARQNG